MPIPDPPPAAAAGPASRRVAATAVLVFAVLFGAAGSTVADYGLTWDEPYYFFAQERERQWWARLATSPGDALRPETIAWAWSFDPYHLPHPPFSRHLSNLGVALLAPLADPFVAARLPVAAAFAATGALLYLLVRRDRSDAEALGAAGLWATIPPVFAHGHFAATDTPLTALAVAATLAFRRAGERRGATAALGVALGAAFATKFTGLLVPAPLLAWAVLHRDRPRLRALLLAAPIAAATAVALVPGWWRSPIAGVRDLVVASAGREDAAPVAVVHRGTVYRFQAPATQPLDLVAVATPVTTWLPAAAFLLALPFLGRLRRDRSATLLALAAAAPIAAVMLPWSPNHDGVRLFLPAFPFLAGLAARGLVAAASWTAGRLERTLPSVRRETAAATFLAVAVAGQGLAVTAYHPYELSYYNRLIGGLPGAARAGMEVSFWMEAFTPETLAALEAALPPGATVRPLVGDPFYFRFLQEAGKLRPDLVFVEGGEADYLLVLSRVAVLGPERMAALARWTPVVEVALRGVPLVRLFDLRGVTSPSGPAPPP